MNLIDKYIKSFFLRQRFYVLAGLAILLFLSAFFIPALFTVAKVYIGVLTLLLLADYVLLFFTASPFTVQRITAERWSNGDPNDVRLRWRNPYAFSCHARIIDELPEQLQVRNFVLEQTVQGRARATALYTIRPTERGSYYFGRILLYVASNIGLVESRLIIEDETVVKVFPSFAQLRNKQLLSHNTTIASGGNRRVRRIGQSMEFEQIKDYVSGDDIRTINWRATARKGGLMVNHYVDEKSQQVFAIIDKGRLMKMPFAGLSLLDYAINSTLALSTACLQKQDKFGLFTFSKSVNTIVPASKAVRQRDLIMDALYKEETDFLESNFESLYLQVRQKVKQRSLLLLYTNFETVSGLERQLPYLRSLAKHHFLVIIFFENTILEKLSKASVNTIEDVYLKTVADKFMYDKKLIVKELQKHGLNSLLTTPDKLTTDSVNKYLELKAKSVI